jgi:hypothetical protein
MACGYYAEGFRTPNGMLFDSKSVASRNAAEASQDNFHGFSLPTIMTQASWKRARMSGLGIYIVKDAKIIREEFLPHVESED